MSQCCQNCNNTKCVNIQKLFDNKIFKTITNRIVEFQNKLAISTNFKNDLFLYLFHLSINNFIFSIIDLIFLLMILNILYKLSTVCDLLKNKNLFYITLGNLIMIRNSLTTTFRSFFDICWQVTLLYASFNHFFTHQTFSFKGNLFLNHIFSSSRLC